MPRTCTAFGRTWSHQQMHGLLKRLVDEGRFVSIEPSGNKVLTVGAGIVYQPRDGVQVRYIGYGQTLWTALCEAVERMEK